MNSYERVMNTLAGKAVDRPPALAILGFYGSQLTGAPVQTLYQNVDAYVAAQQAVVETFGIDMVLAPFELSILTEAFHGEEALFNNQAPNMKKPPAASIEEALALTLPDPQHTARLPFILEATRKLASLYHETVAVFSVVPGPAVLPTLMLGMEAWMEALLFNETDAQKLLEQSGRFWVDWANAQFEAGCDALVVTEGMAASTISTRDLFEQKCLPHIRACFAQVKGPIIFHHTGGPINHIVDLVPSLPNVVGIAVSSKDDLREAREKVGPEVPLFGNIDNLSFRSLSAEQIYAKATTCLETGAEMGPLILCNSGADLPIDTPPENIHALRKAAEDFATRSTTDSANETQWITCGVVRDEIKELHRRGDIQGTLCFFDSMLHMNPCGLEKVLRKKLDGPTDPMVVIYGDCCPSMLQLTDQPGVSRVEGINCCQMLLGKARYRELMHEEAFMLLPEWTPRWKEIIEKELGLVGEVARDLLQETRKKLVYLDTGLVPVPRHELEACAAYTGLPFQVEKIDLTIFLAALKKAEQTALNKLTESGIK